MPGVTLRVERHVGDHGNDQGVLRERPTRIELASSAWKAEVLPLNYTRTVEGGGFEPPKAEPADLQSAPFGHSGTPPETDYCTIKNVKETKIYICKR